jgi:hypothetical protein
MKSFWNVDISTDVSVPRELVLYTCYLVPIDSHPLQSLEAQDWFELVQLIGPVFGSLLAFIGSRPLLLGVPGVFLCLREEEVSVVLTQKVIPWLTYSRCGGIKLT